MKISALGELEISSKRIDMSRISIFKKTAENSYQGGFWGESGGQNI